MSLLAVQPGAIGDLILSLPALAALRQTLGAKRMEIWAERSRLDLIMHPAYADRVRALATTGLSSYPLPERTLNAMREFDVVVSWHGAKLRELTQAVKAAHPCAYFPLQFPPSGEVIHLCDFRRAQVRALFAQLGKPLPAGLLESDPQVFLKAEDFQFAERYLGEMVKRNSRIIVLHPGASGDKKRWAPESFAKVASALAARAPTTLLVTRGPLDAEPVRKMTDALKGAAALHVDVANLRSLAAVLARAALFIGNDTGITHIARAVGVPTIAIFVSSDPLVWAPRGPNVEVLVQPTVEQVIEAAGKLLANKQASGQ
jgi:ADP-heptose:LPS heptosyltransferase